MQTNNVVQSGRAVLPPPTAGPITGFPALVVDLESTVDQAWQALGMLEVTLGTMGVVVSSSPSTPVAIHPAAYRTSTANAIETQRQRLRDLIASIEDLRQRLES